MIVMAQGSTEKDVAGFSASAERAAKLIREVVEDDGFGGDAVLGGGDHLHAGHAEGAVAVDVDHRLAAESVEQVVPRELLLPVERVLAARRPHPLPE